MRRSLRHVFLGLSAALLAAVSLAGCSLAPGGEKVQAAIDTAVETGIRDRMAYNDKKADTLLVLPCDISIGAYYRMQNSVQQEALTMLCSGKRANEPVPALVTTGSDLVPLQGLEEPAPVGPPSS